MNRTVATALFLSPFALAIVLYATGTLERIDAAIDAKLDRKRYRLKTPEPGPARPLEHYAGWWQREEVPRFGTEWVARIIVRTDGQRAWLRMWHPCPPNYCGQGEFEATVHGEAPGSVYALQVVRKKSKDVMSVVTLRPNDPHPNLVILEERRARDPVKNPNDNQSSFTSLSRVK